jgi:hypothetical protein
MPYNPFISWYLDQLCHHSPVSIVIAGNFMLCTKCQKRMEITQDLLARYVKFCTENVQGEK